MKFLPGMNGTPIPPLWRSSSACTRLLRRLAADVAKKMPYFKGKNFLLKCAERPEDSFLGQALVFPEKEAEAVLKPAYRNGPSPHTLPAKSTPASKTRTK